MRTVCKLVGHEISEIAKSIRSGIAEIDNISFVYELILKWKCVVRLSAGLLLQLVTPLISYFGTISYPAYLSFLKLYHWENGWFHAILKKRILFGHVDYIELKVCSLGYVADTEEKPLVVAFGIYVILQNKIILIILFLVDSKQIARLEVGVEFNCRFAGRVPFCSASLSDEGGLGISNKEGCLAEFLCFFLVDWVKFE